MAARYYQAVTGKREAVKPHFLRKMMAGKLDLESEDQTQSGKKGSRKVESEEETEI